MANLDKIKHNQSKKDKYAKIAEIIWLSVGGVLMLCGVLCVVLSVIIENVGSDTTNMYNSPLYGLVEFQETFKTWWNGWMFWKFDTFYKMGIIVIAIALVYLLIVIAVYASKQDNIEKKNKAKKLREKNAQKFLEEQRRAEEAAKANQQVLNEANSQ